MTQMQCCDKDSLSVVTQIIQISKVNNRNKNKVDICTFNLYTKSDHPEIPTYYLQYSANISCSFSSNENFFTNLLAIGFSL